MGLIEKQGVRITLISYIGMVLGYVNKVFLFMILLSTEEMGALFVILPVAALFAQMSNLGAINTVWKFFPYLKNETNDHNGFLAFNFLIVAIGAVFFGLIFLIFDDQITNHFVKNSPLFVEYYYWIIPAGAGILAYKLLDSYMKAIHKNVFSVLVNDFGLRIITTIALLIYATGIMSFHDLVVFTSLSQFIPAILVALYLMKIGEWGVNFKKINISKRFRKIIFSYSIFTYFNTMGSSIVMVLDVLMISSLIGLDENAVYGLVLIMTKALFIPYGSLIRVSTPVVAILWKENNLKKLGALYKSVSSISLIIGLFVFLGAWFSIEEIFSLLKDEFVVGVPVFFFLIIGLVIDAFMGLNGVILISSKKYRYDLYLTLALISIGFTLNILLIPIWGLVGAAIATSASYFFYSLARMITVWKLYGIHPFDRNQLFIFLWFVTLMLLIHFFPFDLGNVFLNMAVKSVSITIAFIGVILLANLNHDLTNYFQRMVVFLKSKLKSGN